MPLEILSPAGSFEALTAAVRAGADAVYFGAGGFNARRNAKNLGDDELAAGKADMKNMETGEKKKISLGENFLDDFLTITTMDEDLSF